MHDDDAPFLREIIATPDDDGPRLVYADWLEERADPRAELIRTQCEEARLDDCRRRMDLRRRIKQILQTHGEEWTAELGAGGSEFRDAEYHRGFVESATMSIRYFLKNGAAIMSRTPLRSVMLTAGDNLLPKLSQATHVLGLRELTFDNNHFPERDAVKFVQSPNLCNLRLFRLRTYDYTDNFGNALASAAFHGLTTLDLRATLAKAGGGWAAACANAPWLSSLERLVLQGANDQTICGLAANPRLAQLKDWDLGNSWRFLSAETGRTLASAPMAAHLERLNLEYCSFDLDGLRGLAAGPWTALEYLNLSGREMGGAGVEALAAGRWPALRNLSLSGCEMGTRGLAALLGRPWFKSLERLNLRNNNLTKQDVLDLIASPNWSHKTHIALEDNHLRRPEAEEILEKLAHTGGPLAAEIRRATKYRP